MVKQNEATSKIEMGEWVLGKWELRKELKQETKGKSKDTRLRGK